MESDFEYCLNPDIPYANELYSGSYPAQYDFTLPLVNMLTFRPSCQGDESRCFVHVSEERGDMRRVTLTGSRKEIDACKLVCYVLSISAHHIAYLLVSSPPPAHTHTRLHTVSGKELMRIAIDASDDSMGDSIKSEVERRRQLCAATEGRRVDPSLIGIGDLSSSGDRYYHSDYHHAHDDNAVTSVDDGDGGELNDAASKSDVPAIPSATAPPTTAKGPSLSATATAAGAPSRGAPPGIGVSSSGASALNAPKVPGGGLGHFKSASLDAFYARSIATCREETERLAMAKAVQVAVVRKGMEVLGQPMTAEQV